MPSIITYDVPSKHVELKEALFKLGYKDQISGTKCEVIYFPNTTLYHETKSPEQALKDVQANCKHLSVKLYRCVATQWGPKWVAICGEDFK